MDFDNRKHRRLQSNSAIDQTIKIMPPPPHSGDPIEGRLTNFSAGGLSLVLGRKIDEGKLFRLSIQFPDQGLVTTLVQVKHIKEKKGEFWHGIEFMSLKEEVAAHIDKMTQDDQSCEERIAKKEEDVCKLYCSYFPMCNKKQKFQPSLDFPTDDISVSFDLASKDNIPEQDYQKLPKEIVNLIPPELR